MYTCMYMYIYYSMYQLGNTYIAHMTLIHICRFVCMQGIWILNEHRYSLNLHHVTHTHTHLTRVHRLLKNQYNTIALFDRAIPCPSPKTFPNG